MFLVASYPRAGRGVGSAYKAYYLHNDFLRRCQDPYTIYFEVSKSGIGVCGSHNAILCPNTFSDILVTSIRLQLMHAVMKVAYHMRQAI